MTFPFVYLNHGELDLDSFDKAESVWIAFQQPVPEAARREIMATCPEPFAGFFRWDDVLFYSESLGDVYDYLVGAQYGDGELTEEAAAAFARAVEDWIAGIHARHPVAFFVGPGRSLDGDDEASWGGWSEARLADVVLPWVERYLDSHPDLPDETDQAFGDEDGEGDPGGVPLSWRPVDRNLLGYLGQHLFGDAMSAEDEARARALTARLGRPR